MSIVAGNSITIHDAHLEGAVVQCIKDWATAYPADLVVFDAQQRRLREGKKNKSGSAGRHSGAVRHAMEIPVKLNVMLTKRFPSAEGWLHDVKIRRYVQQHFVVGRVALKGYRF